MIYVIIYEGVSCGTLFLCGEGKMWGEKGEWSKFNGNNCNFFGKSVYLCKMYAEEKRFLRRIDTFKYQKIKSLTNIV
jgi:hypothetical protein